MKIQTVILICLLSFHLPSSGQADSIINALRVSRYTKPDIIKKGTEQVLNRVSARDKNGAKQIINFLLSEIEDSVYAAFDSYNYALILYWMSDYEELIKFYVRFDSLQAVREHKIKPSNLNLYLNLAWSLPEAASRMFKSIKASGLKDEYKEVLILDLHKWAEEVDSGDYLIKNYPQRINQFKYKYPESRLKDFVEKHVKPGHFHWEKLD